MGDRLGGRPGQCALHRFRNLDRPEEIGWANVVLTRFVNNPQAASRTSLWRSKRLVDLADLERSGIASVLNADNEGLPCARHGGTAATRGSL